MRPSSTLIALSIITSKLLFAHHLDHENTMHMDELCVTSASGYEQKIEKATASISVVTPKQLKQRPYTNLLDAVRELEGVDIGETRDKTGQGSVSIRGMGGDYTLVLIDGRRQNNVGDIYPNNFGGNQNGHIVPLDMIERIEVIRGPMATLYGSDAIGGVVNIITKKISNTFSGSVTTSHTFQEYPEFGNDKTTDINMMIPLVKDKLSLALQASYYDKEPSSPAFADVVYPDGTKETRDLGFGAGGRTVDNQNYTMGAKLAYVPVKEHEIVLDFLTSQLQYDNSNSQVGTLDSIEGIWRASGGNVAPRVGYSALQHFSRDQIALTYNGMWGDFIKSYISSYYVDSKNKGRSQPFTPDERSTLQGIYDAVGGDFDALNATQKATVEGFLPRDLRTMQSRQFTTDARLDVALDSHMIVLGSQLVLADLEDSVFGMTNSSGTTKGVTQTHKQAAVFAEDTYTALDNLDLTFGARYDLHNIFGSNISPRAYAVYTLNDNFTLKGGVGTGYKAPKASDLFDGITGFGGQGTIPFIGNSKLRPESSVSSEMALYFKDKRGDSFNITLYHTQFKDKIMTEQGVSANIGDAWSDLGYTSFSRPINVDTAQVTGVEVASTVVITPQLSLKGNYTYTNSEQTSGDNKGKPISNTAVHMANGYIQYAPTKKLDVYLHGYAEKDRYRNPPRGATSNPDSFYNYKTYMVFNAGASFKARKNVTFNVRVNNILDHDFTTYAPVFTPTGNGGTGSDAYDVAYYDDYNLKAKRREYYVSMNVKF